MRWRRDEISDWGLAVRILVTGRGGAASWTIRGEQIGHALGATVKPNATIADMRAHDVILVVKRVPEDMQRALHRCDRPWVYDIVDAYPQRMAEPWTQSQCLRWLRDWLGQLRPTSVIWPTERMQIDGGGIGSVVYHHARPGIALNPIRPSLGIIGYEGSVRYIDRWQSLILAECQRRCMTFLINPTRLADCDVVLAVRDPQWQSYASKHWKSNVKLANAQASGTPFIGHCESGYFETKSGAEYWAERPEEVSMALNWMHEQSTRLTISRAMWRAAQPLTLDAMAAQVREALRNAL